MSSCRLCETRRPRRWCPGVRGEICAPCCGAEREVTVDCPLDCEYLREARQHEKTPEVDPDAFPNADIRISERFLVEQQKLLAFLGAALLESAFETTGSVDGDVREALAAMIRTYRTRETGLYYESRPENVIAAVIQDGVKRRLEEMQQKLLERTGMHQLRDADVLGIVVFLQRLEIQHNNGRRRGRAFLGFLQDQLRPVESRDSPLIVP